LELAENKTYRSLKRAWIGFRIAYVRIHAPHARNPCASTLSIAPTLFLFPIDAVISLLQTVFSPPICILVGIVLAAWGLPELRSM
jgi:hypothetical protein